MGLLNFFGIGRKDYHAVAATVDKMYEKKGVDGLIEALKDEDLKFYAISKLGRLQDPRSIDALIGLITSEKYENVEFNSAVEALGKLKAQKAVEPLINNFLQMEDIGQYDLFPPSNPRQEAIANFNSLLQKRRAESRMNIVKALGNIGDEKGFDIIKKALKDPDTKVREAAEQAYAKFKIDPKFRVDSEIRIPTSMDAKEVTKGVMNEMRSRYPDGYVYMCILPDKKTLEQVQSILPSNSRSIGVVFKNNCLLVIGGNLSPQEGIDTLKLLHQYDKEAMMKIPGE